MVTATLESVARAEARREKGEGRSLVGALSQDARISLHCLQLSSLFPSPPLNLRQRAGGPAGVEQPQWRELARAPEWGDPLTCPPATVRASGRMNGGDGRFAPATGAANRKRKNGAQG